MKDTPAWDEITQEAITSCETCGKKIWKWWHVGSKKVFPEQTKCAPCKFNIYDNPVKVRRLSDTEIAKCRVLLKKLMTDSDTNKNKAKRSFNREIDLTGTPTQYTQR